LPFLPLPAVDRQHVLAAFILDAPDADNGKQSLRLTADRLSRKIDLELLLRRERQGQCCKDKR